MTLYRQEGGSSFWSQGQSLCKGSNFCDQSRLFKHANNKADLLGLMSALTHITESCEQLITHNISLFKALSVLLVTVSEDYSDVVQGFQTHTYSYRAQVRTSPLTQLQNGLVLYSCKCFSFMPKYQSYTHSQGSVEVGQHSEAPLSTTFSFRRLKQAAQQILQIHGL